MGGTKVAIAALLGSSLVFGSTFAQSDPQTYAAGQVWRYHARPDDAGSLLKIQVLESDPELTRNGPIYHISIIGVHLGSDHHLGEIGHLPVSQKTLDDSVTMLTNSNAAFPSAISGIADWKAAKGGVYTISLAEIVGIVDKMLGGPGDSEQRLGS